MLVGGANDLKQIIQIKHKGVQRSNHSATLPPLNRECETVIGRILITMN